MPRAAVLGQPIAHSLSPVLHNSGYAALDMHDWQYERFEIDAEGLPAFVRDSDPDYRGFSVTMPGKFAALAMADEATERARLIGSANTLVRLDDGRWRADNTDTEGVVGALEELLGSIKVRVAVLIGAGGTARPALWALAQRGVTQVHLVNRSDRTAELEQLCDNLGVELHYLALSEETDSQLETLTLAADVVVSTVPAAGIEKHLHAIAHAPVLDVIYDPFPTALMVHAAANGHRAVGGHIMLAYQSFSQFEQFTSRPAPRKAMTSALLSHLGLES